MQHLQHWVLVYKSAFLKLHGDYPKGGGMCGPKLGHTSAVHVATHLAPLAQILSLEDATCKVGGAT